MIRKAIKLARLGLLALLRLGALASVGTAIIGLVVSIKPIEWHKVFSDRRSVHAWCFDGMYGEAPGMCGFFYANTSRPGGGWKGVHIQYR
jgi:hypothetical protein